MATCGVGQRLADGQRWDGSGRVAALAALVPMSKLSEVGWHGTAAGAEIETYYTKFLYTKIPDLGIMSASVCKIFVRVLESMHGSECAMQFAPSGGASPTAETAKAFVSAPKTMVVALR